jgi:hypothetical protein
MDSYSFKKLSLQQRFSLLKDKGEFIASRPYESFSVHLFALEGHYVEMWQRVGLEYVEYIELILEKRKLDVWADAIDLELP